MPPHGSGPAAAALVDVRHTPYWLDGPAPDPCPALAGPAETDLAVVGGGYTGLWTALLAKERDPDRDVVLLGGARPSAGRPPVATAASARPASPTGCATAWTGSPTRWPSWSGSAGRTSTPSSRLSGSTASTAPSSGPASSPSRPRRGRPTTCARCRDWPNRGNDPGVAGPGRGAVQGRLSDLPRRRARPRRRRDAGPGPAGSRAARSVPAAGRPDLREHARHRAGRDQAPVCCSGRRTGGSPPGTSCSAPTPSRRCCAGSRPTSSRSGTTP